MTKQWLVLFNSYHNNPKWITMLADGFNVIPATEYTGGYIELYRDGLATGVIPLGQIEFFVERIQDPTLPLTEYSEGFFYKVPEDVAF